MATTAKKSGMLLPNQFKMTTMQCTLLIFAMGLLTADAFSPPRVRISPLPLKISIQQIHRSRQRQQHNNNPLHRLHFREAVDDNDTDEKVDSLTSSKIDIVQTNFKSSTSRKTNGIYNRNDFPAADNTTNTTFNNNNNTKRNNDKIKAKSASRLLKAKRLLGMYVMLSL